MHTLTLPARLTVDSIASLDGELTAALDGDARALVLRGGEVFCLGLDLAAATQEGADALDAGLDAFVGLLHRLRTCALPTLARVDGHCVAGGTGLAAACDVVLATERARFALPEALFGMVPAVVWPLLAERMPGRCLRRLALRGLSIGADVACAQGLVDRVVLSDALDKAVLAELRALRRAAPSSVAWIKRSPSLLAALQEGAQVTRQRLQDPFVAEAVRRFIEGSAPWEAA